MPNPVPSHSSDFDNIFTYHPPFGDQAVRYTNLRGCAKTLAAQIIANTPQSREQSLALTNLERWRSSGRMPPSLATNNPPLLRKTLMSDPTDLAIPAHLFAAIDNYKASIRAVENLQASLKRVSLRDTTALQKDHIAGALTHLEGWLLIQRFRLIDREEQARKIAVQTGVDLAKQAARDIMKPPPVPYNPLSAYVPPGTAPKPSCDSPPCSSTTTSSTSPSSASLPG